MKKIPTIINMGGKEKLKPILEASYQNQKEAKKTLEKAGYTYDKALSTNESKVFIDAQGRPNIAFRGSKTAKDFLVSDVALAFGLENKTPRFQEAKRLTKLVEKKYEKPVDVFGHSLGSSLAEKSGAKGQIVTFNKGAGIKDIGKTIPKNQLDIRTSRDPVSIVSLLQRHPHNNLVTLESPTWQNPIQAHSIENVKDNLFV
jgi:hypothetical protein